MSLEAVHLEAASTGRMGCPWVRWHLHIFTGASPEGCLATALPAASEPVPGLGAQTAPREHLPRVRGRDQGAQRREGASLESNGDGGRKKEGRREKQSKCALARLLQQ